MVGSKTCKYAFYNCVWTNVGIAICKRITFGFVPFDFGMH